MTTLIKRAGFIATAGALIGAAACGGSGQAMDDGLKKDLAAVSGNGIELAPTSGQAQVVVSPIEAGEKSAPVRATRMPIARPVARPAPRVASNTEVVASPAPQPIVTAPRPTTAPSRAAEPAPLPPMAPKPAERQSGTYKTEAEVFRQMPWIKP